MARTRASRIYRRILHPSDFSSAARPAFRKAVALAKAKGAEVLVVHVLPVLPIFPETYLAERTYNELLEAQRARGRKQLDRLVANAQAAGVRASGILLDFAIPADRIVRLAKSHRADVIVMGTHGRTGFRRAFMGSVAARVIAFAPCPVLTVRA